jgi:Ferritin-like domain
MASSRPVAAELATIKVHGITREAFLVRSTLAAAAAYGTMSASGLIGTALAQSEAGDVDILNYALTLEYLESTFYTMGVKRVSGLRSEERKLAERLRDDEDAHVDALTATIKKLGGKPAAKPTFDFGRAFGDRATFLKTANTLEDTGVSAYNGAATSISSVDVLAAAGGIVQIEARHAALIRLARDKTPAPQAFDKASQMEEVLAAVQPFIKA